MTFPPALWLEFALAALVILAFLWAKPEYALFAYGFALGFPDLAVPLGETINIRADDVILLLLLPRTFLWKPIDVSAGQRRIFRWQALFLMACTLSIVVELALGIPPGSYEAAKLIGCGAILWGLPRLVQSQERLCFFISGLMCGGIALVAQVFLRLGTVSSIAYANIQELKSAAAFTTWNSNTTGQAAMLFAFAAGVGGIILSHEKEKVLFWLCAATGFAFVPPLMFIRGTSVSLAAGFILFFCLGRRWKLALLVVLMCFSVLIYLRASERRLAEEAAQVNLSTGEGLSHRFDRWDAAFQGIQAQPFVGHGFGQEWNYLSRLGSEGRAHNAYLTVWLELGLGGLLLFLFAIYQFVRAGISLCRDARFQLAGALIISLLAALGMDSLGLPTLYWEKLPTIALSLAIVVVGICERRTAPVDERYASALAATPVSEVI